MVETRPINEIYTLAKEEQEVTRQVRNRSIQRWFCDAPERITDSFKAAFKNRRVEAIVSGLAGMGMLYLLNSVEQGDTSVLKQASDVAGAPFLGDVARPISRLVEWADTKAALHKLARKSSITSEDLVQFFSRYPEVIATREIKDWMRLGEGRLSEKYRNDRRYDAVRITYEKSLQVTDGHKQSQLEIRTRVMETVMDAQVKAQIRRRAFYHIAMESLKDGLDWTAGYGMVRGIDYVMPDELKRYIPTAVLGVVDDVLPYATVWLVSKAKELLGDRRHSGIVNKQVRITAEDKSSYRGDPNRVFHIDPKTQRRS